MRIDPTSLKRAITSRPEIPVPIDAMNEFPIERRALARTLHQRVHSFCNRREAPVTDATVRCVLADDNRFLTGP
jgi:hypothetical protein